MTIDQTHKCQSKIRLLKLLKGANKEATKLNKLIDSISESLRKPSKKAA